MKTKSFICFGTTDVYGATSVDPALDSVLEAQLNGEGAGAIAAGAPVYCSADGTVKKAKADAAGTSKVVGLPSAEIAEAPGTGPVQTKGELTLTTGQWDAVAGTTGGLTAGAIYYLDAGTAGLMTETRPTTTGHIVTEVGIGLSTTVMLVRITDVDTKITAAVVDLDAAEVDIAAAETDIDDLEAGITATINTTGTVGSPTALSDTDSRTLTIGANTSEMCGVTLPTAAAGLVFRFQVNHTNGLRIKANTDDTIRVSTEVSIATGYIEATAVGAAVTLISQDGVNWVAQDVIGTWTVETS